MDERRRWSSVCSSPTGWMSSKQRKSRRVVLNGQTAVGPDGFSLSPVLTADDFWLSSGEVVLRRMLKNAVAAFSWVMLKNWRTLIVLKKLQFKLRGKLTKMFQSSFRENSKTWKFCFKLAWLRWQNFLMFAQLKKKTKPVAKINSRSINRCYTKDKEDRLNFL